jgi:D-alanyl-D-alanine carboxypeptidase (penicillin-binding protein 5/6)
VRARIVGIAVIIVLLLLAVVQLARPATGTFQMLVPATYRVAGTPPVLEWPPGGEAAVAVAGVGLIGKYGSENPLPIASLAKIMTALLVLEKHPLPPGADGPTLTVTPEDVAVYKQDEATGQSLVPVMAGETLSERQALEALLIPSANNIATMLARWVSGNEKDFVAAMNARARQLGMDHTTYTDPSGYSPSTVSTAVDQLKVAEAAMQIPAFREIVRMPQVTLPAAGIQYNVDYVLGQEGIVGVKTGSTDQSGGCFVFAAYAPVGSRQALILGAVLGQDGEQPLMNALAEGVTLVRDVKRMLTPVTVIQAGDAAAQIDVPWYHPVQVTADKSVSFIAWPGLTMHATLQTRLPGSRVQAGSVVGDLILTMGNQREVVPLRATEAVPSPSWLWKLKRIR